MSAGVTPAQIVTRAARKWLVIKDDVLPVVPLVVAVANRLAGPPVWLTMVAPASWGKSDLVMPVAALPGVHFVSTLTDRTFASGKKVEAGDPAYLSLLKRLEAEGSWLLAIKDLGTIQSLPALTRNAIFGQLREIYDGAFRAEYGTGVQVDWRGKLGVLAAATNVIDEYTKWSAELGERFVYFRLRSAPESLVAARAWQSVADGIDDERRSALAAAYHEAFDAADALAAGAFRVPPIEARVVCETVAQFVVEARTPIRHDRFGGYQVGDSEGLGRLTKVLAQLCRAAAICYGEDWVAATRLVVRVGLDSVPRKRVAALRALVKSEGGATVQSLAAMLRCDENTAKQHGSDLEALGLAQCHKPANRLVFSPSIKAANYAEAICLDERRGDAALRKLFDLPDDYTPERERERVGV